MMGSLAPSAALKALWIAVAVQILGRLLDLRWHLDNDEFEGTAQQLEAHWLLWLGVLATLAIALAALRTELDGRGLRALIGITLAYIAVAIWHFVEHANHADPELAHYLLGLTQLGMIGAAIWVTLAFRRGRPRTATA
jgi:hypothetical protein